jgi:hypothetical protein
MSITLSGNRLSFSLNGQPVELEASPGQTLRASYGLLDGRHTLHVSSYSDSTPGAGPVRSWTFDGIGWTPGEPCFIDESREPPTAEPSDGRRSSSGDGSPRTSLDGDGWMGFNVNTSSTTTGSPSESYAEAGHRLAREAVLRHARTIFDELEPQS